MSETPQTVSRREWFLAMAAVPLAPQMTRFSTDEPHFWTLSEAADQIRKRKISSEELTRLCLERIHQRSERLNAFITVTADSALEHAQSCDRDLKRGVIRGRLHGVPIALKDNIDTAGILTTAASHLFAKRIPAEDADMTRRMSQA